MGNWHINIEGVGCHHNKGNPTDADKIATDFLNNLIKAGHSIKVATFTYGGMEELGENSTLCNPGELKRVYSLLHKYEAKFGNIEDY